MTIHSDTVRFSRALRSAILWPVSVIFATAFLLLLLVFQLFWLVNWSDHSFQVIEQTRKCDFLIVHLQTDLRGYFLTGDPLFLESYQEKNPETDRALRELRKLVGDNPPQVEQADAIIEAKGTWIKYAATLLARSRSAPVNSDWIQTDQTLTDALQSEIDRFTAVENGLRERRLKSVRRMKQLLCYAGGGFALLLSVTVGQLVRRQFMNLAAAHRQALDTAEQRHAALARSEAELEKKVADRTTTLQQAVAELEAFSYTVSHDLRAPLRAMQGFAEAVQEDYGDKLDEQGKNYLDRIKNAGQRLDRLIQDLHSYTRISRQDEPLVALDPDKILREIISSGSALQPPATEVRIEGILPKVRGREAVLVQMLTNLLGNAAKFIPPGTTPRIRIWSEERGSRLRLWIEDNGIGIAPKDHDRIFEMFAQLDESPLYGGTGIGLAIVKKAAETMHGSVGVESEKGKGSRFWVELTKASS